MWPLKSAHMPVASQHPLSNSSIPSHDPNIAHALLFPYCCPLPPLVLHALGCLFMRVSFLCYLFLRCAVDLRVYFCVLRFSCLLVLLVCV